ncbi:peptidase A4 family-domain-containing protein [Staphylotrichum tortipilum]|uniref:Peptidase A4 family-domain-containing protein n=1 Tax=Staphylotrichum tortipilum TaxID=2831512 RepID=A0AAN6MFI2_9PEZI|nr:peptidase A4 family-domain-containing protein [Staphylotrichum longicolle]
MWSLRTLLLTALLSSPLPAAAQLSFVASVEHQGQPVDAPDLSFVPIPPLRHRRHSARPHDHHHEEGSGASRTPERDLVSYSSNWCGASQHVNSKADGVASVYGYFTVPDLTLRAGGPAPQFAAAWVGIDGAECNTTLLQAGVTTVVNSNGGQSASAWWEWYPEAAFTIDGLKVKPGDWMSVNITATSASSGTVVITNAQRGYSVTIAISNGPKLCRVDAEWIVEDFYDATKQVAFASFSDVWFVEAGATTQRGKSIGLDGAAMVHIQSDDGKLLCSAEPYDNSNFVIVSH